MNKKNLYLLAGILTGIVFVSSLLDAEAGTLLGSIWLFRLGWLAMSVSSIMSYMKVKKSEKESN